MFHQQGAAQDSRHWKKKKASVPKKTTTQTVNVIYRHSGLIPSFLDINYAKTSIY